jgi:large subunit ribosomal protein L21
MYAIIRSGSKQYKVKKDDVIQVELLESTPGQSVEFSEVLLFADGSGKIKVGAPVVAGSKVIGQYVQETKGPKIESLKYKKRCNQYRKFGHRQHYSQVKILDIQG